MGGRVSSPRRGCVCVRACVCVCVSVSESACKVLLELNKMALEFIMPGYSQGFIYSSAAWHVGS